MASARSLLAQVRAIKAARQPRPSPFVAIYGSFEAFADECMTEVRAGKLCRTDMPVVIECLRRWERDGAWQGWQRHRNGVWEAGR